MTRRLDHADARLWAAVAATVRPLPGRAKPAVPSIALVSERRAARPSSKVAETPPPIRHTARQPQAIEPRRRHRLAVEREALQGRVDLHGLDQDRARSVLTDFVLRGHAEGRRSILVITGKCALGNGVLRRRVPEWLSAPPLQGLIAGLSEAHRRHGGEGALYVALKRAGPPAR